jgi:hypothetical protein
MAPWMWFNVKVENRVCQDPMDPIRKSVRVNMKGRREGLNTGSTVRPPLSKGMSPRHSGSVRSSSNSELYKFHRPKLRVRDTPHPLKWGSELCVHLTSLASQLRSPTLPHRCLRNLSTHRTKRPAPPYPRAHSAAVLVALFVGRAGDLYVLLSQ